MTSRPTSSEVFDFINLEQKQRDTHQDSITALIDRVMSETGAKIGRFIEKKVVSSEPLCLGRDCVINFENLILLGKYTDVYKITSVINGGDVLNQVSSIGFIAGEPGYLFDKNGGRIVLSGAASWSRSPLGIVISGEACIGGESGGSELKQIIIEIVAARSGLWKINTQTEDGSITTVKTTIAKNSEDLLKKYILDQYIF